MDGCHESSFGMEGCPAFGNSDPPNDALHCTARTPPWSGIRCGLPRKQARTAGTRWQRGEKVTRGEPSFCFRCTSVLLGSVRTLPRARA
jgi:hypothetical protein